jgi:hypothetical protein
MVIDDNGDPYMYNGTPADLFRIRAVSVFHQLHCLVRTLNLSQLPPVSHLFISRMSCESASIPNSISRDHQIQFPMPPHPKTIAIPLHI